MLESRAVEFIGPRPGRRRQRLAKLGEPGAQASPSARWLCEAPEMLRQGSVAGNVEVNGANGTWQLAAQVVGQPGAYAEAQQRRFEKAFEVFDTDAQVQESE